MSSVLKFTIEDIKIMSVNESYCVSGSRVKLNSKANAYMYEIERSIKKQINQKQMDIIYELGDQETLHVNVIYALAHNDIYTKQGRLKKRDLDNMHKHTIDGLFRVLKTYNEPLDDCQIFSQNIEKIVSPVQDSTYIYIEIMRQMAYRSQIL